MIKWGTISMVLVVVLVSSCRAVLKMGKIPTGKT